MRPRVTALTLLTGLVLAWTGGCAHGPTAYKAMDREGGYDSHALGDGKHYVVFEASRSTARATIKRYWHRHATELCDPHDYIVMQAGAATRTRMGRTDARIYEGFVQCADAAFAAAGTDQMASAEDSAPDPAPQ